MRCGNRSTFLLSLVLLAVAISPVFVTGQQRRGGGQRGGTARNAAPAQAPARAAAPAIVVVTKSDTTSVRGTILSSDFDSIVVQPALRPGEQTPGEPATIPWGQILRVSSGLTRQKILEEYKKQFTADQFCETCNGDRLVLCPTCKGTRHDPASGADCPTCKGELLVDCKTPRCDHGTIPCPNTNCLKLTVGAWAAKPDGLKWRRFPNPGGGGGFFEVSEHHLGELVVRTGNTWALQGKCPTCGGKTTLIDPACHGTGHMPCPTCLARKDAPPCPTNCESGWVACPTCKGTGLKAGVVVPASAQPKAKEPADAVDAIDQP